MLPASPSSPLRDTQLEMTLHRATLSEETRISVRDLREHMSDHIRHVSSGGSVVVTSRGRPVMRLVPVDPAQPIAPALRYLHAQALGTLPGAVRPRVEVALTLQLLDDLA